MDARTVGQAGARDLDDKSVPNAGFDLLPYLFLAPYLVLFFTFVLVPAVYGIWISLHNWDYLLPGKPFVGLQNYVRSEEHTSELQSRQYLVCRLLLEKKKNFIRQIRTLI